MAIVNRSYIGKGTIYVKEKGVAGASLQTFANCSGLDLTVNTDKKEQKDYETPGGGIVSSSTKISSVIGSITSLSFHPENVAKAFRGMITKIASASQAAEPHVADPDSFVPFNFIPDTSQTITVTGAGGTPTYVAGTDYEVRNSGIKILEGGNIAAGTNIEVTYTSLPQYTIEGLTESGVEYEFILDGLNEADSGKPVRLTLHRVVISPTQAFSFISDDYGELPFEFDVLQDPTKTGNLSKYLRVEMTQ